MVSGWGLAAIYSKNNKKHILLATDGTNRIFYVNPENWKILKILNVIVLNLINKFSRLLILMVNKLKI